MAFQLHECLWVRFHTLNSIYTPKKTRLKQINGTCNEVNTIIELVLIAPTVLFLKLREAEEARERERKRREMEAKRQAKTRVIMSSLFDTASYSSDRSCFLS